MANSFHFVKYVIIEYEMGGSIQTKMVSKILQSFVCLLYKLFRKKHEGIVDMIRQKSNQFSEMLARTTVSRKTKQTSLTL